MRISFVFRGAASGETLRTSAMIVHGGQKGEGVSKALDPLYVLSGGFLDDFDNQLHFSRKANDMNSYSQFLPTFASLLGMRL